MPKIREYDETTSLDDADNFLVDKAQQPNGSRYHRMTWATFKAFFNTQLTQYVTSVAGRGGDVVLSVSDVSGAATDTDLDAHVADTANPHEVTATQVGLGNVDDTSDADKPVSTAQQAALDLKADDADLDAHVADTANPHSVTKAQVGLGSVDNVSAASLRDRSTHTGTQTLSTISDAGTAAASDTGDFATAAQGTLADSALQADDIGTTVQAHDAVLADIAGYTPTKGNILVGNGTTFVQVGVGDDEQALIADSSETAGVKWGDVAASGGREVLSANRTYYVRTDGSDSNDGLTDSSGGAFLTIGKALDTVYSLDISIYDVTIQAADATWTAALDLPGPWVGSGTVTLQGNTTTPSSCVLSVTGGNALSMSNGAKLTLNGFKIQTTTSGSGLFLETTSVLTLGTAIDFGVCAFRQIHVRSGATLIGSSYTISGSALNHIITDAGHIFLSSGTITLSGTPAFSTATFKADSTGFMSIFSMTFSGSATGKRYDCTLNGVINTFGGGATFLPGNASGTTATGGQYA